MTDETRPEWKSIIKEALARWVNSNRVVMITHHWRMTGADTSEDWIELHSDKGEARKVGTRDLKQGSHFNAVDGLYFDPDHAGLVYLAGGVRKTIDAIDAFEKKYAADRAVYDQLKVRFGSGS